MVDWVLTIVIAVGAVLAIKAFVVNPYRIPSSSMEPTLHCAEPGDGCVAGFSDRVLANRFVYRFKDPGRGDIIVFDTPPAAQARCGAGGTFVKRLIGLPGERIAERNGVIMIDGKRLRERRDPGPSRGGPVRRSTPEPSDQQQQHRRSADECGSHAFRSWGLGPRFEPGETQLWTARTRM